MYVLIWKRLGIGIVTVLAVSIIIFLGTKVLPGDAAQIRLGQAATPESVATLRRELGLDLPYWEQYWRWLVDVLRGDLGNSLAADYPVSALIADRYKNTLVVGIFTAIIGIPVSVAFGIAAAMYPGSFYDRALSFNAVTLVALPDFFKAMLLVLIFVFWFDIGSAVVAGNTQGMGVLELLKHFALPVATLCLVIASQVIRMTRAALLNTLSSPHIEWAVLKGLPRGRIILRHALPNSLGPIINIIAISMAYLITSVVVIEVFFAYPGLASLIVQGVQTRDFVLIQALAMIFCTTYVIFMLIADIASIVSNPRLRHPK